MLQSWPQKSRHLASRKSGPLTSEKLILFSRSRRGGRARSPFQRRFFRRLGNLWIFFKAREESSNLRSTRGKSQGKKGNGERRGRRGEEEEKGNCASRGKRREGILGVPEKCALCARTRATTPPTLTIAALFPLPPLVLSLFFPFREEEEENEEEVERKRKSVCEREREKGDKILNFRGRFAVKGSWSRLLARVFRWKDFSAESYIIDLVFVNNASTLNKSPANLGFDGIGIRAKFSPTRHVPDFAYPPCLLFLLNSR